ncbi:MAG: hypothetical protein HYX67_06645, partial [Candidatus Melainabacteria bacterium]|nr:hypothetical protein [Candidatus Melainabacteria bacterium]
IIEHFQELVPQGGSTIGLITMQNGICTSKEDLGRNIQSINSMIPEGTLTIGIYNPTQGITKDCSRAFKERQGKDTPIVVRTRQMMVAISEILFRINPELLWLHVAHSEGGVIGGNAIKGMTEDQRGHLKQQLYFLALGSAAPIPAEFGRGVRNIYSKQDFITGWFALKYANDPKYDIQFVPCKSTWSERTGYFADHAYLGETYKKSQHIHFERLRENKGFYNGNAR